MMNEKDTQVGDTWTDPEYRSKGIAKFALEFLCRNVFKSPGSVWYITEEGNVSSQIVAKKVGFRLSAVGEKKTTFLIARYFKRIKLPRPRVDPIEHGSEHFEAERDHYEDIYSAKKNFSSRYLRERVLETSEIVFNNLLAEFSKGAHACDIGCGIGRHSVAAAQSGATVLGVDVAPSAIQAACSNAAAAGLESKCSFVVGDAQTVLEKSMGKFSFVFEHESLASFDISSLLYGILKGLTPNGIFLSIESLSNNPIFKLNRWIGFKLGRRTRSEYENAFTNKQLDDFRFAFETVVTSNYHLLAPFLAFVRFLPEFAQNKVLRVINITDQLLLKVPFLKSHAFKSIVVATRPRPELIAFLNSIEEQKLPNQSLVA